MRRWRGLRASWTAQTRELTFSFTAPSGFEAGFVRAGTSLDTDGIVTPQAWNYIPSAGPEHWGSLGGTYTVILSPKPTADFYVQLEFLCVRIPVSSCTGTNEFRHAFSNTLRVPVAPAGGGSGAGSEATGAVRFSRTVTVRHADGTTEVTKGIVLVDRDVVESYGNPVKITISKGKIAIDRDSRLAFTPRGKQAWVVKRGTAWFSGEFFGIGGRFAGVLSHSYRSSAPAFTVSTIGRVDTIRSYGDDVAVWALGESSRRVGLRPGEQLTVGAGRRFGSVTKFKAAAHPFWK